MEPAAEARSSSRRASRIPADRRIYLCLGPGGVGKTTVSAALGLALAGRGRATVVLTIDPARRLLGALGLRRTPSGRPTELKLPHLKGRLWACALEPRSTFDRLVAELAPDHKAAETVRRNRVYRQLVEGEAGSQEIAAVAELFALARDPRYEAIVLDTPPAANALHFLEAPSRLAAFLESRALSLLLAATGGEERRGGLAGLLGGRAVGATTSLLLNLFARATGIELIGSLASFLRIVAAARGPLSDRAEAVGRLLGAPESALLAVCGADPLGAREVDFLRERLAGLDLHLAGVVANRLHPRLDRFNQAEVEARLARELDPALARRLAENLSYFQRLAVAERKGLAQLRAALGAVPLVELPELAEEIAGLGALEQLARLLL